MCMFAQHTFFICDNLIVRYDEREDDKKTFKVKLNFEKVSAFAKKVVLAEQQNNRKKYI